MGKTIDSLRAELAEAKAKLEADKYKREEWSNIIAKWAELCNELDSIKKERLSLQSHNAKLREELELIWEQGSDHLGTEVTSEALVAKRALSSQPDNELRDRVRAAIEYAYKFANINCATQKTKEFRELLSSL